ncbi:hypothetical protein M426DRAFT_28046 [Hypoxylon sp. CI-4A]|nr:hypothetical protein M426DRAFT_28046 [Hypoxylon sp. CI-4A]
MATPRGVEVSRVYPNNLVPGGLYILVELGQDSKFKKLNTLKRDDLVYDLYLHLGGNHGMQYWISEDPTNPVPLWSEMDNVRSDPDSIALIQIEQFLWKSDTRVVDTYIMQTCNDIIRRSLKTGTEFHHWALCSKMLFALWLDGEWRARPSHAEIGHIRTTIQQDLTDGVFRFISKILQDNDRIPRICPVGFFQPDGWPWPGFARFPDEWVDVLRDRVLHEVAPLPERS